MSKLPMIARILLGLIFTVFGLNGFLHFIPTPPMTGPAAAFGGAMFATGYLFQLLKTVEVVSGLLLLSNRFVPLALAMLAPVAINIFAFHAVLAPSGLPMAIAIIVLEVFLAFSYRSVFAPMLQARTTPAAPGAERSRVPVHVS